MKKILALVATFTLATLALANPAFADTNDNVAPNGETISQPGEFTSAPEIGGESVDKLSRSTNTCHLISQTPRKDGSHISATGGRTGCINYVRWVHIELYSDGWFYNTLVGTVQSNYNVNEFVRTVSAPYASGYYFTKTISATGATSTSGVASL